jgi:hypothetical protein
VRRLRTPDYVLGLAGFVLLTALFCPWYKIPDGTSDGWRSLQFIDLWLLITALLALVTPLITASRDQPALPVAMDVLTWWASIVAMILVLYRLLSLATPGGEPADARAWGLVVAVIGAVGTFAAAHWALRTEAAPGMRPPPEVRAMPVPPVNDPATPPT